MSILPYNIISHTKRRITLPPFWTTRFPQSSGWSVTLVMSNINGSIAGEDSLSFQFVDDRWVLNIQENTLSHLVDKESVYTSFCITASHETEVPHSERGRFKLVPNPSQLTGVDARTNNEKVLDALKAAMLKKATADQLKYVVDGIEIWRYELKDLLPLIDRFQTMVNARNNRLRGKTGIRRIEVCM